MSQLALATSCTKLSECAEPQQQNTRLSISAETRDLLLGILYLTHYHFREVAGRSLVMEERRSDIRVT